MKKIILAASLAVIFAGQSALAKTEGHNISLNILQTKGKFRFQNQNNNSHTFEDETHGGIGIGYGYAYNFDGVFVRPGVFFDRTNVEHRSQLSGSQPSVKIDNRYGIKADLGYDLDDKLAVYAVGGLSFLDYSVTNNTGKNSSKGKSNLFYGAGINYAYSKKVSFAFEYNAENLNLKQDSASSIATDLKIFKIGMIYKF